MKNIFTLLLGGLLTTSAFANNITLTFPNNRNYQVAIDGRNVNSYDYSNSNTVYLNNLQYGQHTIEVYRMKKNGWGNKNRPVYSSSFSSSPQYDLNIAVDNNGRVQMYQTRSNDYGRNGRGNNRGGYGNNDDRWGKHKDHDGDDDHDRDDHRNGDYNNGDHNNGGYNNGGYNNGGYNDGRNNNHYSQAMSDYDFNQLVQKINKQWIGKMSTAKDGMNNNYFNTYQVKQILQIFSSESDRLELAKLSYRNVVDQQNFRQLYDLFSYQSQTELDRYTRDFRY